MHSESACTQKARDWTKRRPCELELQSPRDRERQRERERETGRDRERERERERKRGIESARERGKGEIVRSHRQPSVGLYCFFSGLIY